MTRNSTAAEDASRRVWARVPTDTGSPEAVAANVVRVCADLQTSLRRWIGPGGHQALVQRALERQRSEHPVLRSFSCQGGEERAIEAAARAHGAAPVAAGVVAMLATLIDLLGHIIGEDLAVRLVEQTTATSGPPVAVAEAEGT